MERSRKDVAEFIQSHYRRTDMSILELTPEFIKDFAAYISTDRGLANGTIWQRCMWLKGVVLRALFDNSYLITFFNFSHTFTIAQVSSLQ